VPPNPFNPGLHYAYPTTCVDGNRYSGFFGKGQPNAVRVVPAP
jgi:hypothetical protein